MRCEVMSDAGAAWETVGGFLTADPLVNSLPLTILATRRDGSVVDARPPVFVVVLDDADEVVGFAFCTPPRFGYLTRMTDDAVEAVVDGLCSALGDDLTGMRGTSAEAAAFARLWSSAMGVAAEAEDEERIHRLGSLVAPDDVSGSARVATVNDRDLLVSWHQAFGAEAMHATQPDAEVAGDVDLRLEERRAYLWCDPAGEVVSYVGHARRVNGVVRVGPVYTPPEHRGYGYASALTADVSRRARDDGAVEVCLYTDLKNPTSNKIYAQIGYEPVCDVTAYRFLGPSATES